MPADKRCDQEIIARAKHLSARMFASAGVALDWRSGVPRTDPATTPVGCAVLRAGEAPAGCAGDSPNQ